ncbi:MAG TPA: hypothetical protein DCE42_29305, partial [Myxococcales bacterium]|nr:hypothetical protein [Myxococcales bacterium]
MSKQTPPKKTTPEAQEETQTQAENTKEALPKGRLLQRFQLGKWRERMILRNQKKARRARRKQRKKLTLRPPTNFKRELYAIPNILCYFRIILIPVILVLIAYESRWYSYLAAILFSVACITDFFDGYLARKLDQITILGKLLDPLADKLA